MHPTPLTASALGRPSSIRYRIIAILAALGLVAYVLRMNISVAAKFMMPELGISQIEMGQVFSSFMVGYALFQLPWGLMGDRRGARRMLWIAGLLWVVTTALTGLAPGLLIPGGTAAFVSLLILRFAHGVGQAAMFPLAARVAGDWLRVNERALGYSLIIAASAAGSAFTGPLVAWSMITLGWRTAFYGCSGLALMVTAIWYWYSTDQPESHPGVNTAELQLIRTGSASVKPGAASTSWLTLLRNPNITLMCLSYFLSSYVLFMFLFWLYLYFVDERKMTILGGGFYTSLPYVLALMVVPAAGRYSDVLAARLGRSKGRRFVAMGGLMIAAFGLIVGTQAANAYVAIGALAVSAAFQMATEGPFWSAIIDVAGPHAGAAGGILNMAGNLGGVVSTALVPVLVKHFGWSLAFGSASALAVVGALIWLLIRIEPRDDGPLHVT